MPDDFDAVKMDFLNAFISIHRDAVLIAIADKLSDIYRSASLLNNKHRFASMLRDIKISRRVQQGDSLGPVIFLLGYTGASSLFNQQSSLLVTWMTSLSVALSTVATDVATITNRGASLGLNLNPSKCDVISTPGLSRTPSSPASVNSNLT